MEINNRVQAEAWINNLIRRDAANFREEIIDSSLEDKIKEIILGELIQGKNNNLSELVKLYGLLHLWTDNRFERLTIRAIEIPNDSPIH